MFNSCCSSEQLINFLGIFFFFFSSFPPLSFPLFQAHLMTAILHFGSSAARTQSQVRRFTSIREATGKLRSAGAGRAVPTSFDLGIDCKVPWRDTIKGLLFPFSDGCSPPVALCSKRSPGRSLLSDPQGEQGFLSLVPYLVSPSLLSHIWEDWNENFFAVWVLLCFVLFF